MLPRFLPINPPIPLIRCKSSCLRVWASWFRASVNLSLASRWLFYMAGYWPWDLADWKIGDGILCHFFFFCCCCCCCCCCCSSMVFRYFISDDFALLVSPPVPQPLGCSAVGPHLTAARAGRVYFNNVHPGVFRRVLEDPWWKHLRVERWSKWHGTLLQSRLFCEWLFCIYVASSTRSDLNQWNVFLQSKSTRFRVPKSWNVWPFWFQGSFSCHNLFGNHWNNAPGLEWAPKDSDWRRFAEFDWRALRWVGGRGSFGGAGPSTSWPSLGGETGVWLTCGWAVFAT